MEVRQESRKKSKKDYSWIFLLLFFLGVGILFLVDDSQSQKNAQPQAKVGPVQIDEKEKIQRVNQHMKEMAIQVERDRLRRAQEARNELKRAESGYAQEGYTHDQGLTFESEKSMEQLASELDRSQSLREDQLTPEQIVNNRLLDLQMEQKADMAYREEYARQFIENARAAGWEIRLGPNFEVLSVKKIRPRKPSLFESGPSQ